ncbi:MAG: PAS domain-containing sensor histidine kinase [Campylobacterota bacterium]|nr:PAS domain-containing sensor histidine kinase [Campylobacterota bacterium]
MLSNNLELLVSNKVSIMQAWISNSKVLKLLDKYQIKKEYFVKNYAFGIFDYYVQVIEKKKNIGDCKVIDEFIDYLKDKEVGVDDLFVICSGFKNALIKFMYDNDLSSYEVYSDITKIYESNFEGVLDKYEASVKEIDRELNVSSHLIDENIIMSTTDKKGIITSVSTAFCEVSGYSREELIGQPHSMVRHPDMPSTLFEELWRTIKNGDNWYGEVKNLKKDGNVYWVDAIIGPEYDINGNHIGYSAIRHDITYKKEAQVQHDIIVEQSQATAMIDMTSMLAHQWRQPLQAIAILIQKLPLEKLIDDDISDETLESVVSSIDEQLNYMSKIIEDFRSFFNPSKDKETILISELLEQVRDFMAYKFKVNDILLNIDIKDDISINIHLHEIIQVFINILSNAQEALSENHVPDGNIQVISYLSENNDNVIFEVIDNAGGIPSIIVNRIFEPYFSTKKNKNGTGLGLYMCKMIVEKNAHGLLSVHNKDNGSVFKITLPLS